MRKWQRWLLVAGVVVLALGAVFAIRARVGQVDGVSTKSDTPPLLLKGIGVNLDYYKPKTGRAGDFQFTQGKLQFDRLWMDYGFAIPASPGKPAKHNPQPTFILPLGTKVRSLVDGIVVGVPKLYSGDYSIHVAQDTKSKFRYETEHVIKPKVKVGDKVTAGQVIAEVSDYDTRGTPGFGLVEIGILKGGNPPQHVCPFLYVDPKIKDDLNKKILAFYAAWEKYRGNTSLYDEKVITTPGCGLLKAIEG